MRHVVFLLFYSSCCLSQNNTVPQHLNVKKKVGAIEFDQKIDNPDFLVCDEYNIEEYYQVNPKYKEGIRSIQDFFADHLDKLNERVESDGYITIRFVINCEGRTDRFRAFFVNVNYETDTGNELLKKELIRLVSAMEPWTPGEYDGKRYDAYQLIKFRLVDKQIVDILF